MAVRFGSGAYNMKKSFARINFILLLCLLPFAGCKSTEEKEADKEAGFVRFHLETNADGTHHNMTVPVYRQNPVQVTVQRDAVLDEGFMTKAEIVDVDRHGGFAIKISFDKPGTLRLNTVSTANKGRRLAVHARWTEDRWLAAPLLTRNLTDGTFVFTPDATREEADRLVRGLNNVIKKLKKPYVF